MTTTVNIQNLKCGGCANTITTKISEVKEVDNVTVSVEDSTVTFTVKNNDAIAAVKERLAAIGYPEVGEKNSVVSKAKSFVSCATGKMNS